MIPHFRSVFSDRAQATCPVSDWSEWHAQTGFVLPIKKGKLDFCGFDFCQAQNRRAASQVSEERLKQ